jgi:undecaprenyl-diphosphatase
MVLVPPERRRPVLLAGALLYAVVMAWSRVYLRAHWLTDVVAGVAFGAAAALTAVAIVNLGSRAS